MKNLADYSSHFSSDGTVLSHPDRPKPQYSLPRAIRNFRLLMQDKEDTGLVFEIYDALPSNKMIPRVQDLCFSERGDYLLENERNLHEILDDHAALRKTQKGSLAHAYCDFMESEGLSAAGLVEEAESIGRPQYDDLIQWLTDRSRDTHDLFHVLTGYGRDTLGELCVLLFTHGQSPSHGHLLIGYAGTVNIKMQVKASQAPIISAARQARRTGRGAPKLVEQPIRELLKQPFDQVRSALNIPDPALYRECLRIWRNEGIDPFNLLAAKEDTEARGMSSAELA